MSAAAEESAEDVEGVMVSSATALLPLLESFVPILVVDFAGFGLGEGFVCFCYFDEFLFGCVIASASLLETQFVETK